VNIQKTPSWKKKEGGTSPKLVNRHKENVLGRGKKTPSGAKNLRSTERKKREGDILGGKG